MLGDILVVKPSFIFPGHVNNTNSTNVNDVTVESPEDLKESDDYMVGVCLCYLIGQ